MMADKSTDPKFKKYDNERAKTQVRFGGRCTPEQKSALQEIMNTQGVSEKTAIFAAVRFYLEAGCPTSKKELILPIPLDL
jgi:hypothetical protein